MADTEEVLRELRARVADLEASLEAAEEANAVLRKSERMLRLVMDTIPQRIFWKDTEYRYLGCNRIFAHDAGLEDPEEIVGRHDFELTWQEVAHLYRADDEDVIEHDISKINYEEPQRRADGRELWLRTSKVPLRDEHGAVIGVFGCYEDITERQEMLGALRRSEERYRTLVEGAADGIFTVSPDGRFLSANPAACEMLGSAESEILGTRLQDVVAESDLATTPVDLRRVPAGGRVMFERVLERPDGTQVSAEISASWLADGRLQASVRDVSERVEAERQRTRLEHELRQAQKLESVGRLAGGIAHDFNNLLTVVMSNGHLLWKLLEAEGRDTHHAAQVLMAAERGAALTQQLLAFSRKQVLELKPVDLNAVLLRMEGMLRRLVGEDVAIETRLQDSVAPVLADGHQIEQVVMNLVVNARDAMESGGRIVLETSQDENAAETVSLVVRDTGVGIESDALPNIFEPFFTTKGPGRGTGLGLAMVYGIVTQSGGQVDVESEVGRGTVFHIRLPATDRPVRASGSAGEPVSSSLVDGGAVILLAEDDGAVRGIIEIVLRRAGYQVMSVPGGDAALELSRAHRGVIDLLITDLVMPDMRGTRLAQTLSGERPDITVLVLSGYSEQPLSELATGASRSGFLGKPFSPEQLLDAVGKLLK